MAAYFSLHLFFFQPDSCGLNNGGPCPRRLLPSPPLGRAPTRSTNRWHGRLSAHRCWLTFSWLGVEDRLALWAFCSWTWSRVVLFWRPKRSACFGEILVILVILPSFSFREKYLVTRRRVRRGTKAVVLEEKSGSLDLWGISFKVGGMRRWCTREEPKKSTSLYLFLRACIETRREREREEMDGNKSWTPSWIN